MSRLCGMLPRTVSSRLKSSPVALFAATAAVCCLLLVAVDRRHAGKFGKTKSLKQRLSLFDDSGGQADPVGGQPPPLSRGQVPTKSGGALDYDRLKREFVRGRDYPPPPMGRAKCRHCQLSSRCYKQKHSLWHPHRCGNLRRFGPGDADFSSAAASCGNLSLIFAGDSRVRALFGAALTVAYPESEKVHRYLDDLHKQTITIRNVTSSNYAMAQRLGGLQKDMWTYKYQAGFADSAQHRPEADEDKDDRRFFLRQKPGAENATFTSLALVNDHRNLATKSPKRFLFVWDYYLDASREVMRREIVSMEPRAVVLEAGLWFVWRRKTDWDKYERNLDQAISNLEKIRQKLATYFDIILFLNDETTRLDEFKLNEGDIDRLNDIARKVADKHPEVIVWDAFLPLQKEYVKYCKQYNMPTDDLFEWRCYDTVHSGFVMYGHYAQQLFNYYCSKRA